MGRKDLGERKYVIAIHERIQEVKNSQEEIFWWIEIEKGDGERTGEDLGGEGGKGVGERRLE